MSYKRALKIDVNDPNDTLPVLIKKRDEIRTVYNLLWDSDQARGGDSQLWLNLQKIESRILDLKASDKHKPKLRYIIR
jgi:hypothetical protein